MVLRLTHLNDDTSWLVSFTPDDSEEPFHLLIDPWLAGDQVDYVPLFSRQRHVIEPAYPSISALEADLGQKISAILLTHEFTDHSHQETLRTARASTPVFAHPNAKKRVDGWKIFDNPVHPIRILRKKASVVPDSLQSLSSLSTPKQFENISVLSVPTNSWLDPARDALHTIIVLTFRHLDKIYSILYSPHGLPFSAVEPVIKALNATPGHECLAILHNWDHIVLPLLGDVNLGKEQGNQIVQAIKPKFWFRTHDELKEKEGLVGVILKRTREDLDSVQNLAGDAVTVRQLASGESVLLV